MLLGGVCTKTNEVGCFRVVEMSEKRDVVLLEGKQWISVGKENDEHDKNGVKTAKTESTASTGGHLLVTVGQLTIGEFDACFDLSCLPILLVFNLIVARLDSLQGCSDLKKEERSRATNREFTMSMDGHLPTQSHQEGTIDSTRMNLSETL
ncbi:hypothetical protein M9H77_07896 [Catharanthus roseus]|uniref:Uncharacterized protein n=1 Tax=Catharanthus roseus TaxID=4058 RepID=A0ACC0BWJ3_CATRO|nr:hypothetical protein M9H77_07896 [Catharanthus roseus]